MKIQLLHTCRREKKKEQDGQSTWRLEQSISGSRSVRWGGRPQGGRPVLLMLLLHGRTWMTSVTPATVSSQGPCSTPHGEARGGRVSNARQPRAAAEPPRHQPYCKQWGSKASSSAAGAAADEAAAAATAGSGSREAAGMRGHTWKRNCEPSSFIHHSRSARWPLSRPYRVVALPAGQETATGAGVGE